MLYLVKAAFRDKEDEMRVYQPDGWYPRFGFEPKEKRIELLVDGGFIEESKDNKDKEVNYPHETGGGWYELSNGERVQGKKDAKKKEKLLKK